MTYPGAGTTTNFVDHCVSGIQHTCGHAENQIVDRGRVELRTVGVAGTSINEVATITCHQRFHCNPPCHHCLSRTGALLYAGLKLCAQPYLRQVQRIKFSVAPNTVLVYRLDVRSGRAAWQQLHPCDLMSRVQAR